MIARFPNLLERVSQYHKFNLPDQSFQRGKRRYRNIPVVTLALASLARPNRILMMTSTLILLGRVELLTVEVSIVPLWSFWGGNDVALPCFGFSGEVGGVVQFLFWIVEGIIEWILMSTAWLGNISWNDFTIGLGVPKADEKTGRGKSYSDVVMKGVNWVLNQWTVPEVVIEGVPTNILDTPARMRNGRPDRRIGHDFVRIGLPKSKIAPVFETLRSVMPAVMSNVSVTAGYYWINASWGVTGNPAQCVYRDASGVMQKTPKAYEYMKMINGSSSLGIATIAVSIGSQTTMQGGVSVATPGKEEFSIKIHNVLHMKKVSYSSPPQSAANGFEISEELYSAVEPLTMVATQNIFSSTSSAFNNDSFNPFARQQVNDNNNAAANDQTKFLL
ncbi:hypothetical protein HYALB_00000324 [Hymenoscyphus albidus]|uniref:Uncharacterized protein n=1 Tax=Hymenoscyphus albidus TaxID=595503 RepID=A0A9N9LSR9_9HELO|nr:hypothetical protein HYALB_00000324 [Hymenoscyphus albidus]